MPPSQTSSAAARPSGQAPSIVYLGMGTNLGDRDAHLRAALAALRERVTVHTLSSVYDTAPELVADQPRFHNAVCEASTFASPEQLLAFLQQVEHQLGRVPGIRYGPRVIDLDVLLYDDLTIATESLTIPHPRLAERAFVLVPLAEIAPQLRIPGLEGTVAQLAQRFAGSDVRLIAPPSALLGSTS